MGYPESSLHLNIFQQFSAMENDPGSTAEEQKVIAGSWPTGALGTNQNSLSDSTVPSGILT
jgi:hypothetical protein